MRLAIFTHVIHREQEGSYSAYSPYIREMNLWLKYVQEVEVIAPAPQPPKWESSAKESYQHSHINFTKIPSFALLDFTSSVNAVFRIPFIIYKIAGAMKRADHLHLRCPGNIGLLACFAQMFFPGKPKTAKYAGNWDPKAKQPWTYKLQQWILSNTFLTRNMTVLVYGNWTNKTENILPFFTASFSETDRESLNKEITAPYKFLFVGNLVPGKQPGVALQIMDDLNKRNIPAELHVYGDGEMIDALTEKANNKAYIHLHGNQPLEVLKEAYKNSHFVILASKSEGWPKAVAEGMFFGCIPVVTDVSCVSWMINYGSRGILIPYVRVESGKRTEDSLDVDETVERIIELINRPKEMRRMSMEAQEWSQEYTLERFEEEIRKLLFP